MSMDYHKQLEKYQAESNELTDKANNYLVKLRKQIGNKIRKEVLIPFCKRNNLELYILIYDNYFITEDNEHINHYDVGERFPDDPASEFIQRAIEIEYYGDRVFDLGLGFDITKEDLE